MHLSQYPIFSSERDGKLWLEYLESDRAYFDKWKVSLAVAELTGRNSYEAVENAFLNHKTYIRGKKKSAQDGETFNAYVDRLMVICERISAQEFGHFNKVCVSLGLDKQSIKPVQIEKDLVELDLNERRSLMRLTSILEYSKNQDLVALADRLLVDESYHCWFTKLLLEKFGNFNLR